MKCKNTKCRIAYQQKVSNKKKIGDTQWKETTLCADKVYMYETPKTHVYSYKQTQLLIQNT